MKIVITGGAHSGKSTLIQALAERGFPVIREAALDVIVTLAGLIGTQDMVQWRKQEEAAFQKLIWSRIRHLEAQHAGSAAEPVFCDRGLLDGLAYGRLYGVDLQAFFETHHAPALNYAGAFVLQTLDQFDMRADTGRITTEDQSRQVGQAVADLYAARGIPTVRVPVMSVEDRVAFVLRHVRDMQPLGAWS